MYAAQASPFMLRLSVAALLLAALIAPSVQGAWTSFHNDERNSGFQPGTTYQVYEDLWWSLKLKNTQIDSSPVVKDGVVLIGSWDKQVRAFDAESGNIKWNATTLTGAVYSTPAIVAGRVFLVDSLGKLEARDLQKGTVLATAAVGPTRGSITIHEGKLFIGNEAGVMQAFDTETLTLLWKFTISEWSSATTTSGTGMSVQTVCDQTKRFTSAGAQIRGAPAVYAGKVIFGSLNHWMFAVDEFGNSGQTTDLMWLFETGDAIFGTPAIDQANNRVIIGSYDEKVYAMPATVGGEGPTMVGTGSSATKCTAPKNTAAWTYSVPATIGSSKVHSSPAVDGARVYFGANNGRVYAVSLSSGTKVWEFATGGQVVSSPAVSNNIVVVGSDDGKLYWLKADSTNATHGEKLKEFIADAPIKSSPAIDGDRTFIASFEGSVYMFGKKIPTRPDLRVSSITYAASVITVTVSNTGDGEAGASKLRLVIDGSLVADIDVPAIAAGAQATVTQTIAATSGTHTVVATADQSNVVTEKEENDNSRSQVLSFDDAPADDDDEKKDSGGIPGPAPMLLGLAVLGLALLLRRRA